MSNDIVRNFQLVEGGTNRIPVGAVRRVNWISDHFPDPADQRDYAREKCVEAVGNAIERAMGTAGLNRAALADKLGKTRGQVSRILSGAHNMTLHTLGDVLWACNVEVEDLVVAELGVVELSTTSDDWQFTTFEHLTQAVAGTAQ